MGIFSIFMIYVSHIYPYEIKDGLFVIFHMVSCDLKKPFFGEIPRNHPHLKMGRFVGLAGLGRVFGNKSPW